MSIDKKISLLIDQKNKIDNKIEKLQIQNTKILAKALFKISDIETFDVAVILGATLKAIKNISDDEKEVLRNTGKTFLKKFKLSPVKNTNSNKK